MLPPKTDPHRRRVMAGRMLCVIASVHLVPIVIAFILDGGGYVIFLFLLCGPPAVLYFVLAALLQSRHFWSLIAAITLCSIELLIFLTATAGSVYSNKDALDWPQGLEFCAFLDLVFITQIILLVRCFAAFHNDRVRDSVGFAPVVAPLSVIPIE